MISSASRTVEKRREIRMAVRPRQGDPLQLAAREIVAAIERLADPGVVSGRQGGDDFVGTGSLGGSSYTVEVVQPPWQLDDLDQHHQR